MRDKDARVRLMAAEIMLERGYGKPEQKSDVDVVHRFALVPEVMEKDEWLKHRAAAAEGAAAARSRSQAELSSASRYAQNSAYAGGRGTLGSVTVAAKMVLRGAVDRTQIT